MSGDLAAFLDAVAHHVAFGLGADPAATDGERRREEARSAALDVLRDCGAFGERDSARSDAAAQALAGNPPLLAAFFQNLDLVPPGPAQTAVALLLMRVMEL